MWLEFQAARRLQRDANDRDTALAWMIEGFARTKRLPALKTLLGKSETQQPPKQQTGQEMRAIVQQLTGAAK